MRSLINMRNVIAPVGIYRVRKEGLIYKELAVYADSLDMISKWVDMLIKECFVETAEDFGLTSFEKLVGPERGDLELSERRDMIQSLINLTVNDNNVEGIKRFFRTIGVRCDIEECPKIQNIYIRPSEVDIGAEERKYIRKKAEQFLPCHNTFTIDFRKAEWRDYDGYGKTFGEIDKLNLTWKDFEEYEEG